MKDLIRLIGTQRDVARMLRRGQRTITRWARCGHLPDAADFAELLALAGVVSVHVEPAADDTVLHCYTEGDGGDPSIVLTLPKRRKGGSDA